MYMKNIKKNEIPIKELQEVQLNIFKELKRVCDKHHIRYYMACGTCLGAVRHKGFIPWDDDVDCFMYLDDIRRLMKYRDEFQDGYFLQCKETDPEFQWPIYRLRDSRTTCIEKEEQPLDINHGFFVDIYPLYYYPDKMIVAHFYILLSFVYRILYMGREPYNHGEKVKNLSRVLLTMFQGSQRDKIIKNIEKKLCKYKNTEEILTYYGLDIFPTHAITYKTAWFEKPSELKFEDDTFSAPTKPKKYLRRRYGNFMKLPPKEEQQPHHSYIFADTKNSYTKYKGIYYPKAFE